MNRVVAGAIGLLAGAALMVGCSDDKAATSTPEPSAAAGESQASSGGSTEVKVDGSDLAGLDLNSVTCVKQGGKITVASGAVGGQQGLGIVMTDADTPTVESLAMVVDGNALGVANAMGGEERFGRGEGRWQHVHHHRRSRRRRYEEPDGRHDHQAVHCHGDLQIIGSSRAAGVPCAPVAS